MTVILEGWACVRERWYAVEVPKIPAPTIRMLGESAESGMALFMCNVRV